MAPELASVVVPQRVTDEDLIAAVAIDVEWVGEVSGLSASLPQQLEIVIEDPEIGVAVFYQNVAAGASAGDVHEGERVAIFRLVRSSRAAGGLRSRSHPGPAFEFTGTAIKNLQFEVANEDDLVVAVTIG